jgi:hypothetical protein
MAPLPSSMTDPEFGTWILTVLGSCGLMALKKLKILFRTPAPSECA